jgi:hypothetical protein
MGLPPLLAVKEDHGTMAPRAGAGAQAEEYSSRIKLPLQDL